MPTSRLARWQPEMRWMADPGLAKRSINRRLLQYWLEKVSQIMVIDIDENPMSFPLLAYLSKSDSLVHTLQSISAAHETYYHPRSLDICLEERCKALKSIREELESEHTLEPQSFLTVFMFGLSSSWIDDNIYNFGQEHLLAARAILDKILFRKDFRNDPFRSFILGAYIYWDMTCSFLVDPKEQRALDTPEMCEAIQNLDGSVHQVSLEATKLFYELACVGRYCRTTIDTGERDVLAEIHFEERLSRWRSAGPEDSPNAWLTESFRLQGLIMIYRICGRPFALDDEETEEIIENYAHQVTICILKIQAHWTYFKFIPIPLLVAAAELTSLDMRNQAKAWFQALYSINRLQCNLRAMDLLTELWDLRDSGVRMSWLELLLQKGWKIMFA